MMGTWILFLLQTVMMSLPGMKMMAILIPHGLLLKLLHRQMVRILYLWLIWIMMAIWILFLHLEMIIPLPGMKMMAILIPRGLLRILLHRQKVHFLYLWLIWIMMGIWILFLLQTMMIPSPGMKMMVILIPHGLQLIFTLALMVQFLYM